MNLQYFEQREADADDFRLAMAKAQGYVPDTCLLGGIVVMGEVMKGSDPCAGCNCSREKCHGREKKASS